LKKPLIYARLFYVNVLKYWNKWTFGRFLSHFLICRIFFWCCTMQRTWKKNMFKYTTNKNLGFCFFFFVFVDDDGLYVASFGLWQSHLSTRLHVMSAMRAIRFLARLASRLVRQGWTVHYLFMWWYCFEYFPYTLFPSFDDLQFFSDGFGYFVVIFLLEKLWLLFFCFHCSMILSLVSYLYVYYVLTLRRLSIDLSFSVAFFLLFLLLGFYLNFLEFLLFFIGLLYFANNMII
jgi:hypothetical protein